MALGAIACVSSNLFRASTFVFLRIIPTRLGIPVLPALFLLYLVTSGYLYAPPPLIAPPKDEKDASPTDKPVLPARASRTDTLKAILLSAPSSSKWARFLTTTINIVLFLAITEFVATPYFDKAEDVIFTRVGAVQPDSAKFTIRFPAREENTISHDIQVLWRTTSSGESVQAWNAGPKLTLTNESDWVGTTKLSGLWPSTEYEYTLVYPNQTSIGYPTNPITFKTWPDAKLSSGTYFRFLATSCSTPNFPYAPLQSRRLRGYDLLADHLAAEEKAEEPVISPEFMLFMGDFIYADVPYYTGSTKEDYRRLYRRNYNSPSFRRVYEHLPMIHTYDDHEIVNNFAGDDLDVGPYPNASDAFRLYNADANPDSVHPGKHYYDFQYGDVSFFVMDTRRHRTESLDDMSTRTMLGDVQLAAMQDWLAKVNNTASIKFVVTSVPFTSLWGHDAQVDSWAGFPSEKTSILKTLQSVPNVFLLSGDRHEFAEIEFSGEAVSNSLREFSISPLSMFYIPFYHTLAQESKETILKVKTELVQHENETEFVSTEHNIPVEKVVKYIPAGNHKWTSFEVDTRDPTSPSVSVEVVIDGETSYKTVIVGKPVSHRSSTALGALVPDGLRDVLDKIGIVPSRWF